MDIIIRNVLKVQFCYSNPAKQLYSIIQKFLNPLLAGHISKILNLISHAIYQVSGPSIYLDYYNNKPISLELKDLKDDGFSLSIIFRIDKLKSNERDNILFSVFNSKGNGFYLYLNKNHILQYATIISDNKLNISYPFLFYSFYFIFL